MQEFHLENIFIKGYWVNNSDIYDVVTHENTITVFKNALKLLNNYNKKSIVG